MLDITDKERIDFLQKLTDRMHYSGVVVLRESTTGRGWRLYETKHPGFHNVREAIDDFIEVVDGQSQPVA